LNSVLLISLPLSLLMLNSYPFMFITIFLMQRREDHASIGTVIGHWIISTWLYQIALAVAIGAVIGYIARKTLKEAHNRQLIDHESFLAYGLGLTFFTLGVVGVLGSDDVLACFIAGNSLTWYDFVRVETEDDTFQDVIDSILNASIFIYLGALIPWSQFGQDGLVPWRLVVLCICILAFRRLPWVMALWHFIPSLPDTQQALFAGWCVSVSLLPADARADSSFIMQVWPHWSERRLLCPARHQGAARRARAPSHRHPPRGPLRRAFVDHRPRE
jgi:NhaP-type Na+/H+ or K+/H+ antiporter